MSDNVLPISAPWFQIARNDTGATVTVGESVSVDLNEGELAFLLPVVTDWLEAMKVAPYEYWGWDPKAGECRLIDPPEWDAETEMLASQGIEFLYRQPWIWVFRGSGRLSLSIRTGLKDGHRIDLTEEEAEGILLAIEASLPIRTEPDYGGSLTIPLIERAVLDMMPPGWKPDDNHPISLFGHERPWSRRELRRITKKQIDTISDAIDEQRGLILREIVPDQGGYKIGADGGIWTPEPSKPADDEAEGDGGSWSLRRHLIGHTTDQNTLISLAKAAAVLYADNLLNLGKFKGGKSVRAVRYREIVTYLELIEKLMSGTSSVKDWDVLSEAMDDSGDIALRVMAASLYERDCLKEGIPPEYVNRTPLPPVDPDNPFALLLDGAGSDTEATIQAIERAQAIEREVADVVRSLGKALKKASIPDGREAFGEMVRLNGVRWIDAIDAAKEAIASSRLLGLSDRYGVGSDKEVSGKATADLRFAWDSLWIWFEATQKWPTSTAGKRGFTEFMCLILDAVENCGVLDGLLSVEGDSAKKKRALYDTLMNAAKKAISGFLLQEQWNLKPPHVLIANPMQAEDGRFLAYDESGAGPAGWYTRWRATSSTSLSKKADPDVIKKTALDDHLKGMGKGKP